MFPIPKPHLTKFKQSISYSGPIIWNTIPYEINTTATLSSFSDKLVKWMTRAQFLVEIFQFAIILLQYVSITKLAICYANYANIGSEFYFIVFSKYMYFIFFSVD